MSSDAMPYTRSRVSTRSRRQLPDHLGHVQVVRVEPSCAASGWRWRLRAAGRARRAGCARSRRPAPAAGSSRRRDGGARRAPPSVRSSAMSASMRCSTAGRSTFTTTSRPSRSVGRMHLRDRGRGQRRRARSGRRAAPPACPARARPRRCASAPSNGATRSCSSASSSAMSGGSRSRRVERIWPNLTKIGPSSSSARRRRWPRGMRGDRGRRARDQAAQRSQRPEQAGGLDKFVEAIAQQHARDRVQAQQAAAHARGPALRRQLRDPRGEALDVVAQAIDLVVEAVELGARRPRRRARRARSWPHRAPASRRFRAPSRRRRAVRARAAARRRCRSAARTASSRSGSKRSASCDRRRARSASPDICTLPVGRPAPAAPGNSMPARPDSVLATDRSGPGPRARGPTRRRPSLTSRRRPRSAALQLSSTLRPSSGAMRCALAGSSASVRLSTSSRAPPARASSGLGGRSVLMRAVYPGATPNPSRALRIRPLQERLQPRPGLSRAERAPTGPAL